MTSNQRWITSAGLALAASALACAAPLRAQEIDPLTGEVMPGTPAPTAWDSGFSVSYGVGLTTNYISKGLTQTDNGPAVQPYLELGYGMGYVGFWASNASFGGVEDNELDVSIGIRPEFGDMSFDLGFVQYLYQDDPADYGEAYLFGTYAPGEDWSAKLQYYHEVYADKDWFYVGGSYGSLPWDLAISGGIGTDFGTSGFDRDSIAADIGIGGPIGDHGAYDFRVSDSSIEGTRFYATLSFLY